MAVQYWYEGSITDPKDGSILMMIFKITNPYKLAFDYLQIKSS